MNWQIVYTKQAQKDAKNLASAGLQAKAEQLLVVLAGNPYQNPPPFQHRLVYQIFDDLKTVKVLRMWTHYE